MEEGTLLNLMEKPNYKWNWKKVIKFSTQIIEALNSLHNWKPVVVHRDIKSHNLLSEHKNFFFLN